MNLMVLTTFVLLKLGHKRNFCPARCFWKHWFQPEPPITITPGREQNIVPSLTSGQLMAIGRAVVNVGGALVNITIRDGELRMLLHSVRTLLDIGLHFWMEPKK